MDTVDQAVTWAERQLSEISAADEADERCLKIARAWGDDRAIRYYVNRLERRRERARGYKEFIEQEKGNGN